MMCEVCNRRCVLLVCVACVCASSEWKRKKEKKNCNLKAAAVVHGIIPAYYL